MQLPKSLLAAIEAEAERVPARDLQRAAEELSQRYRAGEKQLVTSEAHRVAYLLTRMPATYAAIHRVLLELRERAPAFAPESLLDLGSGPGTAVFAAAELFPSLRTVTAVEHDSDMTGLAQKLATGNRQLATEWRDADVRSTHLDPADLVIAAYSLGELDAKAAAEIARRAWVAAKHAFVVIEPGTPRGFENVLQIREGLGVEAPIASPCPLAPHECPMATLGDWCHFAARVERSSLHRRLKSGALGYEDEKFSYTIFTKDAAVDRAPARVVRHPQIGKGHVKLTLCTGEAITPLTITRSQGAVYKRARKVEWGEAWDRS
jgi:ribosomal protein RSM22 (predicted rRNA methylase)